VKEYSVTETVDTRSAWLSAEDLATARARLPVVYVEAVPVRVDSRGQVTSVGLLLRQMPDGEISRAIVSGRVLLGEQIRDCLIRNLEKDLGPVALPRIPPHPAPFTVAEYFPDPSISGFHDPRQHAVSLVFLVPVDGDCQPSQDALDLAWLTPSEALRDDVRRELASGHARLVRMALAHAGLLD
jgi:ADP-ribose pyrophosphatase YjhB (NUDIX family)